MNVQALQKTSYCSVTLGVSTALPEPRPRPPRRLDPDAPPPLDDGLIPASPDFAPLETWGGCNPPLPSTPPLPRPRPIRLGCSPSPPNAAPRARLWPSTSGRARGFRDAWWGG